MLQVHVTLAQTTKIAAVRFLNNRFLIDGSHADNLVDKVFRKDRMLIRP